MREQTNIMRKQEDENKLEEHCMSAGRAEQINVWKVIKC